MVYNGPLDGKKRNNIVQRPNGGKNHWKKKKEIWEIIQVPQTKGHPAVFNNFFWDLKWGG